MNQRAIAQSLARQAVESNDPLGWFERLYALAETDGIKVPWVDLVPNSNLVEFLSKNSMAGNGRTALKIGCGFGDDAEYLSALGFQVTAFDIAPTAIAKCHARFPHSLVNYVVADLFAAKPEWMGSFDLVVEAYTLQVLPAELRKSAMKKIAEFVATEGYLLAIARARNDEEDIGLMPWPLTIAEINSFTSWDIKLLSFEDFIDNESPPVRRVRAYFQKPQTTTDRPAT
jgi:SAM-dependent methyltransferase